MLTRFVIQRREPFAGGHELAVTGAYEKIVGKIYGEVDPKNRLNRVSERSVHFEARGHGAR